MSTEEKTENTAPATPAPAAAAPRQEQRQEARPFVNRNSPNFLADKAAKQAEKFCWFKKHNIKYIDYKNPDFLLRFVNDQGKMYPRRITGTSLKYQRQLAKAIKKARHLALLPFVADSLK